MLYFNENVISDDELEKLTAHIEASDFKGVTDYDTFSLFAFGYVYNELNGDTIITNPVYIANDINRPAKFAIINIKPETINQTFNLYLNEIAQENNLSLNHFNDLSLTTKLHLIQSHNDHFNLFNNKLNLNVMDVINYIKKSL